MLFCSHLANRPARRSHIAGKEFGIDLLIEDPQEVALPGAGSQLHGSGAAVRQHINRVDVASPLLPPLKPTKGSIRPWQLTTTAPA